MPRYTLSQLASFPTAMRRRFVGASSGPSASMGQAITTACTLPGKTGGAVRRRGPLRQEVLIRWRGFTLLELLVAITVLSIVSLIAWRGLDSLVHTRERLQPEAEEVRDLLVAFGQMERDLAQVVNTAFVPLLTPPLVVRSGSPAGFELVRMAPATPGAPSALQLVVYELRDGQLVRHSSAPMDTLGPGPDAPLATTTLLANVQALQVRVWQPGRGWLPPETATQSFRSVPGIEVQLDLADGRRYRRVLLVG